MLFDSGITVTVIRPPAGDAVGDRGAPSTHDVAGCAVAQKSTSTDHDRRQTTVTTQRLLCPPGSDIQAGDKIQINSVTYLVEGEPWTVHSPFGDWTPGMVVSLKGVQ